MPSASPDPYLWFYRLTRTIPFWPLACFFACAFYAVIALIQELAPNMKWELTPSLIILLIASLGWPQMIARWFIASRLYGGLPLSLGRHMLHNARRSPQHSAVVLTGLLLVVSAFAFCLFVGGKLPLAGVLLVLAPTSYFSSGTAFVALPPSALFLSASSDQGSAMQTALSERLPQYRFISLLFFPDAVPPPTTLWLKLNSIRTINHYEWRSVVLHLMDVVPLIIIDVSEATAPLTEEMSWIRKKGYDDRAIVLRGAVSPDALALQVKSRLGAPIDIVRRKQRQSEYTEMTANIPAPLRESAAVADYMVKARFIERFAKRQFLKDCKVAGLPADESRLYEDIPRRPGLTREEEKEYLRTSRALEEVSIILLSALEDQSESSGEHRDFNIAVVKNSIGAVELLRCDWERARDHIGDAIRRLEAMCNGNFGECEVKIPTELATAHFNLGDTYMAQYRDNSQEDDRAKAIGEYRKTLAIESECSMDSALTKSRLRDLGVC